MKYYSEEIIRKIYENALIVGIDDAISKAKSIELPDKYGRLIDADECGKVLFDKYTEGLGKWDELYSAGYRYALKYFSQAPTVLEARR